MRPRVLHLISSFAVEGPPGGVARYVIELSRFFDPAAVDFSVAGLWDYHTGFEKEHCERLNQRGIRSVIAADWDESEPYQSCLRALDGLQNAALGKVDLIHSHGEFTDLAAILLARRMGAKAIIRTVHNEIEWSKRPIYGRLFPNLLYPFTFDVDLAISRRVADNLNHRPMARILRRQAKVVYNGVDFNRFQIRRGGNHLRMEFGISSSAPLLGSIGRLTPQKGYDILLDSFSRLLPRYPDSVLVIIGDGPMRAALEDQSRQLAIRHAVHFAGPRKEIERLLPELDLFVSSSRWEGLPTVLLESTAAGVPIVATRVSGSVEIVQEGVNGLLVPPEDPIALSNALAEVVNHLANYRERGQQTRNETEKRFSLQAISQQLTGIYRGLSGL